MANKDDKTEIALCRQPDLRSITPNVFQTAACLISDCIDSFNLERTSSSSSASSSWPTPLSAEFSSRIHCAR
uniref:Uncharacterized protein MANES_06G113700 n=1 Tax=Rhizophora mucronata TaxID=61149 RepID=A0A2P2LAR5_RHIMU